MMQLQAYQQIHVGQDEDSFGVPVDFELKLLPIEHLEQVGQVVGLFASEGKEWIGVYHAAASQIVL